MEEAIPDPQCQITCPLCEGDKAIEVMHAKMVVPGTPPPSSVPCFLCEGAGWLTSARYADYRKGRSLQQARSSLGIGLREAAYRIGMLASRLSEIEFGGDGVESMDAKQMYRTERFVDFTDSERVELALCPDAISQLIDYHACQGTMAYAADNQAAGFYHEERSSELRSYLARLQPWHAAQYGEGADTPPPVFRRGLDMEATDVDPS